MSHANCVAV